MIHELRTYTLRPGTVAEAESRFEKALPGRLGLSKLGGFWHTEVGPLNQILHLWPYDDLAHRTRVREEARKAPNWPPDIREFIVSQESEILVPAPFMHPLSEKRLGNIYEMRMYTYQAGTIPEVVKRWGERVEERERFSPLAGAWYTDIGGLNKFIHLWPYESFEARERARAEAARSGRWPAPTREFLVRQETKILVPATFSPLR
ncbi:MAG: NIPSNAP family protein [Chloroflexi bacterium]|nr:NIPSNAP family protein [Chloroflexota bacterium]